MPRSYLVTSAMLAKAIKGSRGNLSVIADRLNITRACLERTLTRPELMELTAEIRHELEGATDQTESLVFDALTEGQVDGEKVDLETRLLTARWALPRLRPSVWGDQSKTVIEGGDKPVKVLSATVSLDALNLDLETRRKLLAAIDEREAKLLEAQQGAKAVVAQVLPTPAKPPADDEDE